MTLCSTSTGKHMAVRTEIGFSSCHSPLAHAKEPGWNCWGHAE